MSGVSYTVTTKYVLEDQATAKAGKVSGAFDALGGAASKASGMFDSLVGKLATVGAAMAGGAIFAGVKAIKTGLLDVNASLEQTEIGLASTFQTIGATDSFTNGLTMAKDLLAKIRDDSAALPGEFADFAGIAQRITPILSTIGVGVDGIRDLTRMTAIAGANVLGGDFAMAGREMAELLRGRAGGHNTLGSNLGITTETKVASGAEFNKASIQERMDHISKMLSKGDDALKAYGRSWKGLTSTLSDNVKRMLGTATAPLFERVKGSFESLIKLTNSARMREMAHDVGVLLVRGFDLAIVGVQRIADHWTEIRDAAVKFGEDLAHAFEKAWPAIERVGTFLGQQLKDPGELLLKLAGIRVGLAAASNAGSIASGVGAVGESIGAAGAAGAAGAMGALGIAAAALVGAIDVLTMKVTGQSEFYDWIGEYGKGVWRDVKERFGVAVTDTVQMLSDLWTAVRPVVDILGIALLGAIDGAVMLFQSLTLPIRLLIDAFKWAAAKLKNPFGDVPTEQSVGDSIKGKAWSPKALDKSKLEAELAAVAVGKVMQPTAAPGKMSVTVNAPLTVLTDADPERLAMKVATKIDSELRNAKTALSLSSGFRHE
ncbi:MAG: hypothetical protein HYV09_26510 [Deltaproteobacteria bacterium]|nr:hypothetical protein [Deltaproteobacteria bacterium]